MNKTQKARLKRIVKADCLTRWQYQSRSGMTCAIGALMVDVGVEPPAAGTDDSHIQLDELPPKLINPIRKRFGISLMRLLRIQEINDTFSTPEIRRKNIIEYIDTLPVSK